MRSIYGTHETPEGLRVARWFGQQVGRAERVGPYSAMGWLNSDGAFTAVVLFNDYNGSNIEMHMAGTVCRQGLREAFRYAFDQLKVQRITVKPYRSSFALRRIVERLGFKPEGVMKRYYGPAPAADAFVFRLDRDAAEKWMS